jgi:cytochrome c
MQSVLARKTKSGPNSMASTAARPARCQISTIPDANKNSGIVWNEATFGDYIKNPAAKVPDTKMIFPGIKNEQQAKDLWAYISQFDADGNSKK